jgi:3-oxoadipate enol-lactonase/4-carboxymuconolactone decarboxylase
MAFATRDGVRLYWRAEGEPERPALLLLNSIGTDLGLWDRVVPHLTPDFRVLRMDTRGHGASDAPGGDYDLAMLAADARAVLDAAGVARARICGVSLGGMVAMRLALDAPDRVEGLVLACTSAAMDREAWETRRRTVLEGGLAAIEQMALERFFSDHFRRTHRAEVETVRQGLRTLDPQGYAGCCAAVRDMDLLAVLPGVQVPTLVLSGARDVSTPFEGHGSKIRDAIPGAQTVVLDTAHLACLEAPLDFAAAVRRFFAAPVRVEAQGDPAQAIYEAGLKTRRQVLGDAWVDRSLADRTPLNADFQAMITRYAWNEIWGRPGLDHRTRRLLVLAITAALGRWEEFRLHVRAGVEQGGFSEGELKETLMQAAIYAGVPTANTAFAEAAEVLRELRALAGALDDAVDVELMPSNSTPSRAASGVG